MEITSNVHVPLESNSLPDQIAAVLSKHPALYYPTKLENSQVLLHPDKGASLGIHFPILLIPIIRLCLILYAR